MATPPTAVLKEISIDGLEVIHGVTFDGERVWAVDGTRGGLVAIDPESGRVLRRLDVPGADAGLTFDGKSLWAGVGDRIWKLNPQSGEKLADIPAPDAANMSGLAWAAGALFVGSFRGAKVFKVDPQSGRVLKVLHSDRFVTGITFTEGELWHGSFRESDSHAEIRRVDESGEVLERIPAPPSVFVSGIEADGRGRLWMGSARDGKLRAIESPARRRRAAGRSA